MLPGAVWKAKSRGQNNDLLIQILRVILIKRAGHSFLESEYIDSREKRNDPKCMEYLASLFIEISFVQN